MKAIAYYRVSTSRQHKSGLGLQAQQFACKNFISNKNYELTAEYTEVESGKKDNRPELTKAIAEAQKNKSVLIIAKLDRLSRNAAFTLALKDSGVQFIAVDMPEANHLTIGIMALIAQDEQERISARTKAALLAKKEQGFKLGKPENLTKKAQLKGAQSQIDGARKAYRLISGYITVLVEQGKGHREIARILNTEGHRTRTGKEFTSVQVGRILKRLQNDEDKSI